MLYKKTNWELNLKLFNSVPVLKHNQYKKPALSKYILDIASKKRAEKKFLFNPSRQTLDYLINEIRYQITNLKV